MILLYSRTDRYRQNGKQDVNSSGVSSTLPGHLGEVTTLKFLPSKDKKSNLFVSGDSTGLALVWKENDTNEVGFYETGVRIWK